MECGAARFFYANGDAMNVDSEFVRVQATAEDVGEAVMNVNGASSDESIHQLQSRIHDLERDLEDSQTASATADESLDRLRDELRLTQEEVVTNDYVGSTHGGSALGSARGGSPAPNSPPSSPDVALARLYEELKDTKESLEKVTAGRDYALEEFVRMTKVRDEIQAKLADTELQRDKAATEWVESKRTQTELESKLRRMMLLTHYGNGCGQGGEGVSGAAAELGMYRSVASRYITKLEELLYEMKDEDIYFPSPDASNKWSELTDGIATPTTIISHKHVYWSSACFGKLKARFKVLHGVTNQKKHTTNARMITAAGVQHNLLIDIGDKQFKEKRNDAQKANERRDSRRVMQAFSEGWDRSQAEIDLAI
ncbi:hypothetical protein PInf_016767 [Phytophthora infestans]|nr:hypothetical protein PInf_016767 [Phytophthora infestans]